ncbi:MAG TPA: MarC family protein [Terriglobales bacterium]|nr:MarC family protein [Terriglobales bacterium]
MHLVISIFGATLLVVAALFPIVNPLGSSLIFLGLTGGYGHAVRASLVRRISLNSFLLLLVSMLIGSRVLDFFGVSLPVVQLGGGLVVMAMGWNMLQQNDSEPQRTDVTADDASQQAFYPLTLPLTVGPGSISVAVALGANTHRQMYPWAAQLLSSVLGPLLIGVSVYICYSSAERLERFLGKTGLSVFIRLSAFIVLCIGIQIFWNGLAALLHLH